MRAGKALYVGASSMYAWQFAQDDLRSRASAAWRAFVSMQNFYNLVYREEEREMMQFCADEGIAVIPVVAAGARLSRAARGVGASAATVRGRTDAVQRRARPRLATRTRRSAAASARRRDKSAIKPAVIALAWVLSKPYVTAPIIGASKPHHLADAVAALALKLDARAVARLEEPYRPKEVVGHQ